MMIGDDDDDDDDQDNDANDALFLWSAGEWLLTGVPWGGAARVHDLQPGEVSQSSHVQNPFSLSRSLPNTLSAQRGRAAVWPNLNPGNKSARRSTDETEKFPKSKALMQQPPKSLFGPEQRRTALSTSPQHI